MSYRRTLGRVVTNPLLLSGIKLGTRVNVFKAMQELGKPCDIGTLAKETNLKQWYLDELMKSYISSEVVEMTDDNEVLIPDWKIFDEVVMKRELDYIDAFKEVAPTLEECFTSNGPQGYSHDDAPFVMDYVRTLRKDHNDSIAKELAQLIGTHADKFKNILDIGCGTGDITTPLASALPGSVVTGCDISETAISVAKVASVKVKNVSFGTADIYKLPETWTQKFDAVLMFDVLHELPHPESAIKELLKVLASDGIVILVDPKVSSDPKKNVGNIHSAQALTISAWWCIPSSSCSKGCGHGVGWGWENKEEFLTKAGLEIKSRVRVIKSDYNYAYICKRK